MSFDFVVRTSGVVACLYTVAYFITTMSVSALNAVSYSSGPMCGQSGCVSAVERQKLLPGQGHAVDEPLWMAASYFTRD